MTSICLLLLVILILLYVLVCAFYKLYCFKEAAERFEERFGHHLRLDDFLNMSIMTKGNGRSLKIYFGDYKCQMDKILDIEIYKNDQEKQNAL